MDKLKGKSYQTMIIRSSNQK